jgi:hypothetical protein
MFTTTLREKGLKKAGAYILENTPLPRGGGNISRGYLRKKYEKVKRKRGKM